VIDRFSNILCVMRCARICVPALTRCLQFLYNDCIFPQGRDLVRTWRGVPCSAHGRAGSMGLLDR